MYDDTIEASSEPITCSVLVRPFAKRTTLAYEVVLKRTQGDRVYERSIAYLNGADARDFLIVCPQITLTEAFE